MALIELKKVTKIYDDNALPVRAVNEVDLIIEPGEFTAIVGPSGSGKTTLLNVILGLVRPAKGRVKLFDQPPGTNSRLDIGYLPQKHGAHCRRNKRRSHKRAHTHV